MTPKSAYQQCIENYASLEAFEAHLLIVVPNVPRLKKKNNWKAIYIAMCDDGHGVTLKDFKCLSARYSNCKVKLSLKQYKESGISYDKQKLTAVQMEEICK